ncbi:MAG: hypothetical protein ACYDEV_15295 [Acidiferrobacter sp.]
MAAGVWVAVAPTFTERYGYKPGAAVTFEPAADEPFDGDVGGTVTNTDTEFLGLKGTAFVGLARLSQGRRPSTSARAPRTASPGHRDAHEDPI